MHNENRIEGIYCRHDDAYTVPARDTGAGIHVEMDLIGDVDIRVWPNGRALETRRTDLDLLCGAGKLKLILLKDHRDE